MMVEGSETLAKLIVVCNQCGHKWPVSEVVDEDGTLGICVELPCLQCGYAISAVVAHDDEEVTPLGKIGAPEEFEGCNPGPVNLTERALKTLRQTVDHIEAVVSKIP